MLLNTQAVRGLRIIRLFALMQVLPQLFNLLFLFFIGFFWNDQDVPVYAVLFGYTVTGLIGWFFMEISFRKMMNSDDKIYKVSFKAIVSISVPMFMTASMMIIIAETGVLMLGFYRNQDEVGYYAIAVRLATLTTFVLQAVNSMAGPKFSELFYTDKMDVLFYVAKKSAKLIFYTTTPILIFFICFGRPTINIIFGPKFAVAYLPLVILVIGQFINSVSGSTGMFLNMTGNQKAYRNIMCIATILNVGLNFCLIPWIGFNGTAISAMVSISFWNIAALSYIKQKYGQTTGYFPKLFF
jgi:O-antigen/teichoic acid export membrane protein